ncbi:MAG: type II secretion system minor pseudopilin GspK [Hyphomonas sp.]|nr:type II secretion system minor pseudopilin GspK [Hyphomonas sp.]
MSSRRTLATWAARSAEALALSAANELVAASRLPADGDPADRARTMVLPISGGQILLTLSELPPCLNLNALGNPEADGGTTISAALSILLEDAGVPGNEAARLVATLADWIDIDSAERAGGAEDAVYLSREGGFRTGNQPLGSFHELAPLPGFTPELRKAMSSGTCILPDRKQPALNVNALSFDTAPVLRAASKGSISLAQARRFIDARPAAGWASVQQVREYALGTGSMGPDFAQLPFSVQGALFQGEGRAQLDTGDWTFRFLLDTDADGTLKIVWRTFGSAG